MSNNTNGQEQDPDHRATLANVDSEYAQRPTTYAYTHRQTPVDEILDGNYPREWLTADARLSVGVERCILILLCLAKHYNLERRDTYPSLKGLAAKHFNGNTFRVSEILKALERAGLITLITVRKKGITPKYTFTWYNPITDLAAPIQARGTDPQDDPWSVSDESREGSQVVSRQGSRQQSREGSQVVSRQGSREPVNEQNKNLNVNLNKTEQQQTKERMKRLQPMWDTFTNALKDFLHSEQRHLVDDLQYAGAFPHFEDCLANHWEPGHLAEFVSADLEKWAKQPGAIVEKLKALAKDQPPPKAVRIPCGFDDCDGKIHIDLDTGKGYACPSDPLNPWTKPAGTEPPF